MKKPCLAIGIRAMTTMFYGIWVTTVLAFAWATTPYLIAPFGFVPPAWLAALARAIFYRDYVF